MIKNLLKNSQLSIVAGLLACSLSLSACNKDQPPVPPPAPAQPAAVATVPKPVQVQASSALRISAPPVSQFDFSNKKDPFKPYVAVKVVTKSSPDSIKKALQSSLPIHSFEVNQFKLIGIITGGRENQAMVIDPGGKGYVLKTGMTIGRNSGKIVSITSKGVDVVEQFKDESGRVRKETIKLVLPRKQ